MFSDQFIFPKKNIYNLDNNSLIQLMYLSSILIIWLWLNFYPIFTAIFIYVRITTNLICVNKKINFKSINKNFIIATYLSVIYKLGYSFYYATIWCQIFLIITQKFPEILNIIFPNLKRKYTYFTVIYLFLHLWMCWA